MLPDFGGSLLFFVVLIFVIKGEGWGGRSLKLNINDKNLKFFKSNFIN